MKAQKENKELSALTQQGPPEPQANKKVQNQPIVTDLTLAKAEAVPKPTENA